MHQNNGLVNIEGASFIFMTNFFSGYIEYTFSVVVSPIVSLTHT